MKQQQYDGLMKIQWGRARCGIGNNVQLAVLRNWLYCRWITRLIQKVSTVSL